MKTIINNLVNGLAHNAAFCGILGAGVLALSTLAMGQTTATTTTKTPPSLLPPPPPVVSTIPSNGDVNPYGVAFVPANAYSDGVLQPNDILVSNFNNSLNLQGTGSTIVRVDAHGNVTTFFQAQKQVGMTAALGVLQRGIVFAGTLATIDGTSNTVQPGSLMVFDRKGKLLGSLVDTQIIDGPWGMAINDNGKFAQVFFSNVLSGTVIRMDVEVSNDGESLIIFGIHRIGSGFNHRTDPAALVLGPSGLFYNAANDTLYVASSADNAVYAIANATSRYDDNGGTGAMIYQDNVHLHGPLDLTMTPAGNLIVANSDGSNADPNQPSELVEFTTTGQFVSQFSVDPNNGGAFGLNLTQISPAFVRFAAVDDNQNTLTTYVEPIQ
jgi:hypothetical protein